MERTNCTPGVEQKSPHLMPGVLKEDLVVASNRSQVRASCRPAAAAIPSTAQRVIRGRCISLSRVAVHSVKIDSGLEEAASSLRSWPAEKAGPYPSSTNICLCTGKYLDLAGFSRVFDLAEGRIDFANGG